MQKLLLITATLALLGAGCAQTGQAPSNGLGASAAKAECAQARKLVDESNELLKKAKLPLSVWSDRGGEFPASFPPPPLRTILCGSTGNGVYNHFYTSLSETELKGYYTPKLEASGYKPKPSTIPENLIDFTAGEEAILGGGITKPSQGIFVIYLPETAWKK